MPPLRPASDRSVLRQRLLAEREQFASSPQAADAARALEAHLTAVLSQLAPECLGLYWPVRSEFNAAHAWHVDEGDSDLMPLSPSLPLPMALPFARRNPPSMQYRRWDGTAPDVVDECGIASTGGAPVVPDVVLVPCVGFTDEGFRLGYGGGFFDRWLAAHPDTTTVGVAWSVGRMAPGAFVPERHDQPLMLVVTEAGVVGG